MLLVLAGAVMATACQTLSAPPAHTELDAAAAAVRAAENERDAALAEAAQARADAAAAVQAAEEMADTADFARMEAQAEARRANAAQDEAMAKVDAMMMAAYQPSAVMVSADLLDAGLLDLDAAQASLAGPDSIYLSSIRYAGETYSALLKYHGGATATVTGIFGHDGKLIPDSVGLGMTELSFLAPNRLLVSNVEVGGAGYSGELQYVGGNRLRVANIRSVTLPPTAGEMIAQAEADAAAARAEANAAMADAAAARAEAASAQARLDAMIADAFQPSQVMVSAEMLDASLANLDQVRVSLAGPDSIYLSNIRYGGVPYSALLRYTGGTSATVKAVYGPMGKLIPDSVGLSQTTLGFVAPAALAVSNVEVGGAGYSGTLEYAGGDQLRVTNIRRVTLPPTAAEMAQATIAEQRDRIAALEAAVAEAMADADATQAMADAAMADAAMAQARLDAMMAHAYQPSEVMVSAAMLDSSMANLDQVQVSLAGPDSIYLSNIRYGGVPYSALLRYGGGTSATVEAVYGPMGKLIPDSVGLSQTTVDFVAPAALAVSNVEVGGAGYSGTLEYVGGNRLRVTNIRRVTLPPTAAEVAQAAAEAAIAAARAAADAEVSAAMADAAAAMEQADTARNSLAVADAANTRLERRAANLAAQIKRLTEGIPLTGINPGLLDLESARFTVAGPNSIYISGIRYAGQDASARVRYEQGRGKAEALFIAADSLISESVNMDAAELELVGDSLRLSNVGIQDVAHTFNLTLNAQGGADVTMRRDGWKVRTAAELQRDKLITEGAYLVNGFAGGRALAGEGAWSESGATVTQTDAGASHAKYTIPTNQSGTEMLFGVTASAAGKNKVGFGLHLLASDTPQSGNTWNYGRSYLIWATRDPFYDSDDTHLQFYESSENNTLSWIASRRIDQPLSSPLTLEALYHNGVVTLLVSGDEQLSLEIGAAINAGDHVALRSLGGPVEFTQVYVTAR